jgi:flagellar biosynthesis protein FlhA
VIEAFGQFLVGGNFAVGFVVFAILVVINFIVITKGAGRIAEVGARFTLDAMPGKQMAIDADLNAGVIGEEEARKRRAEVAEEADFYGAMDGSSKFVRGDAIAGILILVINVVGGLIIGMMQHDLSLATAAHNYVLLAIGDGLVAQIPALLISTAAGLVVSRVGKGQRMGEQLLSQLFSQPHALAIAAGVLGALGLIPGMPNLAFLSLAAGLAFAARSVMRRRDAAAATAAAPPPVVAPSETVEVSWDDLVPIDVLGLEVGYRLIPLVDPAKDGELLRRIKAIRKKFAQEIGFLPPAVHIRDNLELAPSAYRVLLNGVVIGEGECHIGKMLAIDPGESAVALPGIATKDPAFGLPAHWIDANQADQAHAMGCTVVDAGTVVATHLSTLVHGHSATLLGRQEVQSLLERAAKVSPKLIEELTPKLLPLATVHRVLQGLLDEQVNIRDLRTILETLADHAPRMQDAGDLTSAVRNALGRAIVQQIYGTTPELAVIGLDGELERVLLQVVGLVSSEGAVIEPGLAESLVREAGEAVRQQEALGHPAVLLVPDRLRTPLFRMLRRSLPALRVLAHGEIPAARTIRVTATVGGKR